MWSRLCLSQIKSLAFNFTKSSVTLWGILGQEGKSTSHIRLKDPLTVFAFSLVQNYSLTARPLWGKGVIYMDYCYFNHHLFSLGLFWLVLVNAVATCWIAVRLYQNSRWIGDFYHDLNGYGAWISKVQFKVWELMENNRQPDR